MIKNVKTKKVAIVKDRLSPKLIAYLGTWFFYHASLGKLTKKGIYFCKISSSKHTPIR